MLDGIKEFVRRPVCAEIQSGVVDFRQHRREVLADRAATSPAL